MSSYQYQGMLSNISEKAHTVSVGWLDELSYTGNLTTFQQLDFTNGKTASVFLQLHIWQSLLLRQAEAGSRCDSAPLQRCRLLGPDNTGLLWGAWAPRVPAWSPSCGHRGPRPGHSLPWRVVDSVGWDWGWVPRGLHLKCRRSVFVFYCEKI